MVGITNIVISVSYFCLILENVLGFPALPCLSHIVSSNLHFCLCYLLFAIDPTFISSTFIPDEEKIYFFFTEVGREYDFIDKFIVSRVSQICVVSGNDGVYEPSKEILQRFSSALIFGIFSQEQTNFTSRPNPSRKH